MSTRAPPRSRRASSSAFATGDASATATSMPARSAKARVVRAPSPLTMESRQPELPQRAPRPRSPRVAKHVRDDEERHEPLVQREMDHRVALLPRTCSLARPPRPGARCPAPRPAARGSRAGPRRPATTPDTPWPGMAVKSVTSARRPEGRALRRAQPAPDCARSGAPPLLRMPARPRGRARRSRTTTSRSTGRPRVRVPVLSRTTWLVAAAASSTSAPFTRRPARAAAPVASSTAMGVARPRLHGQAMTTTATPVISACGTDAPRRSHAAAVARASSRMAGTKIPVTRSARAWIRGFCSCARSTAWMIPARTVSAPTRITSNVKAPCRFIVPPITDAPGSLVTGRASPVTSASSTSDPPSTTTPSSGIRSPGTTSTRSPTRTSATGTTRTPAPPAVEDAPVPTTRASAGRAARAARPCRRLALAPAPPRTVPSAPA